jgi:hypothetical protein
MATKVRPQAISKGDDQELFDPNISHLGYKVFAKLFNLGADKKENFLDLLNDALRPRLKARVKSIELKDPTLRSCGFQDSDIEEEENGEEDTKDDGALRNIFSQTEMKRNMLNSEAKSVAIGINIAKKQAARNMLEKKIDVSRIAMITELSLKDVEELRGESEVY